MSIRNLRLDSLSVASVAAVVAFFAISILA